MNKEYMKKEHAKYEMTPKGLFILRIAEDLGDELIVELMDYDDIIDELIANNRDENIVINGKHIYFYLGEDSLLHATLIKNENIKQ